MSTLDEALAAALLPDAFKTGGSGQELFLQIYTTLNSGNTPTPSQLEYLRQAFSRVVTENLPPNEAFGLLGKSGNNKPLFADVWDFTDKDIRQMIICTRFEIVGRSGIKGTKKEEVIMDEFSINSKQTIYNTLNKHPDFVDRLKNSSVAALNDLLEELEERIKKPV